MNFSYITRYESEEQEMFCVVESVEEWNDESNFVEGKGDVSFV